MVTATPTRSDARGIDLGALDLDGSIARTLYAHEREHAGEVLLSVRSDGEWRDLTVAETAARVRAAAAGLLGAGLRPGDRLAVMSHSRLEWTLCDYAAATVGVVTVPVYETSSDEQVRWVLGDSGAVAVCCETTSMRDRIEDLRAELPGLTHLWCFDDGGIDAIVAAGARVPRADVDARLDAVRGDDLQSIVYTSGTTGRPKGCMLTHRNCLSDLVGMLQLLAEQLRPGASTLLFLPLAHIFGRAVQIGAIATRTRLGYCPDVATLPDDLLTFRPTFVLAVPRVFEKVFNAAQAAAHQRPAGSVGSVGYRGRVIAAVTGRLFDDGEETAIAWSRARAAGRVPAELRARHAVFDQLVYSKLRAALGGRVTHALSAGAPLGARLGHFFDGIGLTVLEAYGLTETIAATFNPPDALRIGTVGRPIPGVELRLDADGEVLLRGPNVFGGYWHNETATAEAFEDGWFRTGDVGSVDADGYLSITGRKKELLVTAAGKNVAPAPLEDRLRAHPLVSQCLVVGEGRPYVAALVTLDAEAWPAWAAAHGLSGSPGDHLEDPELVAEIQSAVDQANAAVSRAESIRRFLLLPDDFTLDSGELTPTLKLRRAVIHARRAEAIERLYPG